MKFSSTNLTENQIRSAQLAHEVEMFLAGTPIIPDVLPAETKQPVEGHFKKKSKNLNLTYKAAREIARKNAERTFIGKPCRTCKHVVRFVSNMTCTQCSKRYAQIHQDKLKTKKVA